MNICTTFHNDSSNSCRDISIKIQNVNLLAAQQEKSKLLEHIIWEPLMSVQSLVPIHQVLVEIFITLTWRIHAVGNMNVCRKFHDNPSSTCEDISFWTKVLARPAHTLTLPRAMPLAWLTGFPDAWQSWMRWKGKKQKVKQSNISFTESFFICWYTRKLQRVSVHMPHGHSPKTKNKLE